MVGALHGAIPGDIGADNGFHADLFHLLTKIHGIYLRGLRPALDGHPAFLNIDAHSDLVAVLGDCLPDKAGIRHRRGTQNHPVKTGFHIPVNDLHAPDTAAHLAKQACGLFDSANQVQIGGSAVPGTLQVHHVDMGSTAADEILRNC